MLGKTENKLLEMSKISGNGVTISIDPYKVKIMIRYDEFWQFADIISSIFDQQISEEDFEFCKVVYGGAIAPDAKYFINSSSFAHFQNMKLEKPILINGRIKSTNLYIINMDYTNCVFECEKPVTKIYKIARSDKDCIWSKT